MRNARKESFHVNLREVPLVRWTLAFECAERPLTQPSIQSGSASSSSTIRLIRRWTILSCDLGVSMSRAFFPGFRWTNGLYCFSSDRVACDLGLHHSGT